MGKAVALEAAVADKTAALQMAEAEQATALMAAAAEQETALEAGNWWRSRLLRWRKCRWWKLWRPT